MRKHTLEYVKRYFEEHECELLETEYAGANTVMRYKCSCGNVSKTRFGNFQQGKRCKMCGNKKIAKKIKLTFQHVKQYFIDNGCELLETEYNKNSTKMKYKCTCGNISRISFHDFRTGRRCAKCGGAEKLAFEYVCNYFREQGCELLEKKYISNNTKMRYKCGCGNISKIVFRSFQQGARCIKCGAKKRSGKNHFNYNPNLTDEEREKNKTRLSEYIYKKWRTKVYKKDNYLCQKCFQKGKYLNAHHIESWASNRDLRLIQSNGITLCQDCHIKFHQKYGYNNNNRQQLNKFL